MQDRFKFRAVLKTDKFTILVETFYILNSCYFIDINKAEVEFKCKYPDECFWDFIEEIEKQDYIQEISIEGDLIITKDFTNLVQCTGLKDKFGKLIYEKDIVRDIPTQTVYKVSHKKCAFYLENKEYVGYFHELRQCFSISRLEIIGNVYENSELLNEVENDT